MTNLARIISTLALIAFVSADEQCSCGLTRTNKKSQNRIVGGTNAMVNEFPLIGAIALVSRPDFIFCASTIITKRHAITAAHCNKGPLRPVLLIVGEHNTQITTESVTYKVPVEKFITHEQFDRAGLTEHDIAVLFLAQELTFGPSVGPACFPSIETTRNLIGKKVRLAGWGLLRYEGLQPNILQKVDVDVINMEFCEAKYGGTTEGQLCTYTLDKDACQGDSGGPVLYMDPQTRRYSVVGVVSFGPDGCAVKNYPGVNTNVSAYGDWILSKIAATDPTSTVCSNK